MKAGQKQTTDLWLNDQGQIYSDKELIRISKDWDENTWEAFLVKTVERSTSYMREAVLSPTTYTMILQEMTESIWAWSDSSESADVSSRIRLLIRDHLTPRQQHVIRLTFWDGLSERKVGEILGISRTAVATYKSKSLKKLKGLIEARLPVRTAYEGANKNIAHSDRRSEQIREVYRRETSCCGKVGEV
jgi:RNA polymerase sigma factor (sigma-70 family)